jgi:hypothetical protein
MEKLVAALVGRNKSATFGERFGAVPGSADLVTFAIKIDPETIDALDGRGRRKKGRRA